MLLFCLSISNSGAVQQVVSRASETFVLGGEQLPGGRKMKNVLIENL